MLYQPTEPIESYADRLYERSIPGLLMERAEAEPDVVTVRYKRRGVYHELTWSSYLDRVRTVGLGLLEIGLRPGDRVAIMGDPSIEWLLADLATVSMNGISFGIYSTSSPEQVGYQVRKVGARIFFAGDQEHLDKLLDAPEGCDVERIVLIDDRTLFLYRDPRILTFATLEKCGRGRATANPDEAQRCMRGVRPDAPAVITFTSGTTGPPKGVVHTHRDAIVGMTFPYLYFFEELRTEKHRTVTYLALAHLVERSMTVWLPLISRCMPHIGEKGEGLRQLLVDVQPTFFHGVPRIWEKLAAQVTIGVEMSPRLNRKVFELAMRVGRACLEGEWEGRVRLRHRIGRTVARLVAFWPALYKIGLGEVRGGFTGGAAIPPRVQALWQTWGVPLRNAYGITEGTQVGAQKGRFPHPDSPMSSAYPKDVRIGEQSEVLVAGRGLFQGYWDEPEATASAMAGGFLHTGDVAVASGVGFRIVDRIKDLAVTAGGKNIAPTVIESEIKASAYISEAILIADGRRFPTCLIELDFDTVAQWSREHNVTYAGYSDLAGRPEVYELVRSEIERANARFSRVEQVKRFAIIPKELDPEAGDTTPTRKIKRKHIEKLFADLIESMYRQAEADRGPAATH
ncbi:MAG: AMP-binding protein [Isosphaeraceae bacterium]|jgi:long-chain acyl-CoA synthetase